MHGLRKQMKSNRISRKVRWFCGWLGIQPIHSFFQCYHSLSVACIVSELDGQLVVEAVDKPFTFVEVVHQDDDVTDEEKNECLDFVQKNCFIAVLDSPPTILLSLFTRTNLRASHINLDLTVQPCRIMLSFRVSKQIMTTSTRVILFLCFLEEC